MKQTKATATPKSQSQKDKFIAMANELGSDTNEKSFDTALKRVGKAPMPSKSKKDLKS